jgi:FecR protein
MIRFASCACVAALLLVYCPHASAQDPPDGPVAPPGGSVQAPAHIAVVDGTASLERDGRPDPAPLSTPLLAGDRLRTENGRVEVRFEDGATLHLDSSTTVDFQSDEVIRLLSGRVRLTIPGPRREVSYRIDTPGGWVQIQEPGEYRVGLGREGREARAEDVELVVLRGAADLLNEDGQTSLRAGERAFARSGSAPSAAYVYNSAAWDAFDRWSNDQRSERAGVSAQYLPETVRSYSSTFDRDGSWRYDTSYGYVWYPTVRVGWRPYFYGRWASLPSFGWTWIGTDAWAWPTHHYGRWGVSAGAWFWIPGRTWSPAWVSWAYAPGYVSWCPLGWDNRPVAQFVRGGYYGGRYDPWNAWTVVPHQRFGSGYVNSTFIGGTRLDARSRGAFVVRPGGPESRGYAVPRSAAPIYAAGSRRPGGYAGGTGRVDGQGPRPRAQVSGAPRTGISGAPRTGPANDAAADFRSRRPSEAAGGSGYPAPSRAPRSSPDVIERMGGDRGSVSRPADRANVARPRDSVSRPADSPGVTVYRGAVPRRDNAGPGGRPEESRRLEVPGYQRAPAGPVPSPRTWPGQRQAAPRTDSPRYGAPIDRPGRVAPDRPSNDAYRAVPRPSRESAPAPSYRPYGGVERRAAPSSPPPSAAPAREQGARPSGGAPRGDAPSRARPSGQGQADRGTARRR